VRKTAAGLAITGFIAGLTLIMANGASAESKSNSGDVFDHHGVSDSRQACDESVFDHHEAGC
jgi:hypothetical protein